MMDTCHSGEFFMAAVSFGQGWHKSWNTGLVYPDLLLSLHVARDPTFYIYKAILPILAIFCFGMMQYFVELDDVPGRLSLVFGMVLTMYAIQWVILDRLPRVPYLTTLDLFIFYGVASLFLMSAGTAIVGLLAKNEVV
jgi:hypothetical protein